MAVGEYVSHEFSFGRSYGLKDDDCKEVYFEIPNGDDMQGLQSFETVDLDTALFRSRSLLTGILFIGGPLDWSGI
ncbi:hypothetical protein MMC07_009131, partial [Pseudocyphellaria aurata]|nr:hypothetical protein [Pseudocyphellaria aurata]